MEKQVRPVISFRTGKYITYITCSLAFYFALFSDYYEPGKEKDTVVTGLRNYHDKVMSNLLGFDVRESLKSLRRALTFETPQLPQEAIDKINRLKQEQGIAPVAEAAPTQPTAFSKLLSNVEQPIKPILSSEYNTEDQRIDEIIRRSKLETKEMEERLDNFMNNNNKGK
ncbi:hypothetical protein SAMD00019534_067720 [Acytostelium subglobosum LB1]|uniref:hypothetical protein n=1 Tax=Acytostelium subglobosum LB1 TaxID=1410327 RepID=UPI000644FAC7|nr:hypothetical protein SAMD00019534_067720 [Acytostelium subglobosum LB1]GAM23597.1 hypothetical protein SAMD00019534_067720 [Acytostelium subglobosum LB1]|eukprot:XP_012753338.1 hypothetical protein SAMD00019534_067720 [Acytostelium subglobosum LB1]